MGAGDEGLPVAAESFLLWLTVERGRSANTLAAYRRDLGGYVDWLGSRGLNVSTVGHDDVVCSTQPSWMDVRSPMTMSPSSPRSTAPGQIEASAPMRTEPMTTASGCT